MLQTIKGLVALVALGAVFLMSACGGDGPKPGAANDMAAHVPTEAAGVVLVQLGSILEKADYDGFTKMEVFADMLKEVEAESPALVPFMKDPASSGVDLSGNMAFYFQVENGKSFSGFLMPVADPAKIGTTLETLKKESPDVQTTDHEGYQLHTVEDDVFILQSDALVAITNFNDEARLKALLQPEGNGIHDNQAFADQMPTGQDLAYWIDGEALAKGDARTKKQLVGLVAGLGLDENALVGNSFYGSQSFENGKMEGDLMLDFNDDLAQKLESILPKKMAVDYANYFPGDDLVAGLTFGISTSGTLELVNEMGVAMFADNYLKLVGLTLGDIEKGLTGDLAVGVYPEMTASKDPVFVAALGLKTKETIETLLGRGMMMGLVKKEGEQYLLQGQPSPDGQPNDLIIYGMIKDDAFVLSNKKEQLDQALAGNSNAVVSKLQEGFLGLYLNYELLEKSGLQEVLADVLPPDAGGALALSGEYQTSKTASFIAQPNALKGITIMKDGNMNALKSSLITLNEMHKKGLLEPQMDDAMDEFEDFDEAFDEEEEPAEAL